MQETTIAANGFSFRVREAGDAAGEPVLLLHGFPETSHMWIGLMETLAAEGYRCLAPDQRGYSPGARPSEVEAYGYRALVSDVFALADARGFERFHLVAHDWGSIVGWAALGLDEKRRIASFTSLSIPHAQAQARATYDDPTGDLYRGILTWLMTPGAPEATVSAGDGAAFRGTWTHSAPEQVDEYMSVLTQPGAIEAAASWYRAADAHKRALLPDAPFAPVSTPTLLLWGKDDPYVKRMSVDLAAEYMRGEYRVVELDGGHWVAQEHPQRVAEETLAHLRRHAID